MSEVSPTLRQAVLSAMVFFARANCMEGDFEEAATAKREEANSSALGPAVGVEARARAVESREDAARSSRDPEPLAASLPSWAAASTRSMILSASTASGSEDLDPAQCPRCCRREAGKLREGNDRP